MLEGEMSYDFKQAFTENFNTTPTVTVGEQQPQSSARTLWPTMSTWPARRDSPVFSPSREDLSISGWIPRPASVGTAISSIENLRANNVSGILYPGAGLEGHIGPGWSTP